MIFIAFRGPGIFYYTEFYQTMGNKTYHVRPVVN